MKQRRGNLIGWYLLSDILAALLAWYCLYFFRKIIIEKEPFEWLLPFRDNKFFIGLLIVSQLWILLHYFSGTYTDVYRKSRLQEMLKTSVVTLVGTILIFFTLLLDDNVRKYSDYYFTFLVLWSAQWLLTFLGRLALLNLAKSRLRKSLVSFPAIIVGNDDRANEIYEEFSAPGNDFGYRFVGYIALQKAPQNRLTAELPHLGGIQELEKVVLDNNIEEVLVAIESDEHYLLNDLLLKLADKKVWVRIIPDMYDILSGTTKMNSLVGEAFIEVPPSLLNEMERISKRWFDLLFCTVALLLLWPLFLLVAIWIKLTSKGPVFYAQERLGQYGRPFRIFKFRSMYVDAENQGPKLTSDRDSRITPAGRFIRKYRIDELPQFINVIKGEMSLVGPRAERQYFADQIVAIAPHYKQVLKVKPGITSLGMVKYGYASTVEEMVKRLKYDVIYIENMGVVMDFKIIIYTVLTVLKGRGK
ncbi:MAG: sugar transferase [Chitinophagales bacterium]